jgi:hypothetical protein
VFTDFLLNGQGHGQVAEAIAGCRFDPGLLRPYIDSRGNRCVTINTGRNRPDGTPERQKRLVAELVNNGVASPVFNATSLRKEEWVQLDMVVLRAARQRLRAWADLAAANTFGGFNGMSKTILEHETMSDPGEAIVDMDGLTEGRTDSPKYQLEGLPLPITHSDFWFSSRRLAVSRNTGTPLDTTMAEAAGRRVAEMVEKTLIGVETGITYGSAAAGTAGIAYGRTPSVYGYTNFPNRITKTNLNIPTGSNASATLSDVLAMRDLLYNNRFYGPFMLYHSTDWDRYLDNDYILTGGNTATQTLRERIRAIEGISDVRRLDFLTNTFTLLMVQMTADVARAVNGMDITTVQWESVGGMRLNFKVMAILVPQLRADFSGNTGIVHATTA